MCVHENGMGYMCVCEREKVCVFWSLTCLLDLQIFAVTPVSELTEGPHLERVPERIKRFYRTNNISRFHYDRPFHKGPKDRENEFRVLIHIMTKIQRT